MDEYYSMDEELLSREDKERRGRAKRRGGAVFILAGAILLAGGAGLTAMNYRDDALAGETALENLHELERTLGIDADGDGYIGDIPVSEYSSDSGAESGYEDGAVRRSEGEGEISARSEEETEEALDTLEEARDEAIYERYPAMSMPTVEIDGYSYIGYLQIPAIDRTLPVLDEWSYPNLKISPCRFVGTVYAHDIVICAHNYERHFGLIKTLEQGDEVTFTDTYGDQFFYEVSEVIILDPYDSEEMKDASDWDMTLFTCTIGGATRVTVRCVMTSSVESDWTEGAHEDMAYTIESLKNQSETSSS